MVALLLALAVGGSSLCFSGAATAADENRKTSASGTASVPQDDTQDASEWRSRGIAHIELPLGFRARLDARTTRNFYHSEDLAEAFLTRGPQFRYKRALESRISLSRALARNIEFEIAWGARSRIANIDIDLLHFRRQTVGAFLRFVH